MWLIVSLVYAFTFGSLLYAGIPDEYYTSSAWVGATALNVLSIVGFLSIGGLGVWPNFHKMKFLILYFILLVGFSVVNILFHLIEDDSRFFAYTFSLSISLVNFIASIFLWYFYKHRSTKFTIN